MHLRSFKNLSQSKKIGLFLIGTTLMWSTGLPVYMGVASAASLTEISDTLSSSAPSATPSHLMQWTTPTGVAAGQTIVVTFDPVGSLFTVGAIAAANFSNEAGIDVVAACGPGGNEATLTSDTESFTLTMCAGDSIPATTLVRFTIATGVITSPATPGSYVVRVTGTQTDSADTRVVILNTVSMTARVDTVFTFTVTGLATSSPVNGTSTDITTTPTAIAFNTLAVGSTKTAAQRLNVTTNAMNGFVVTLQQNQNLFSSTGADIDLFKNGVVVTTPEAWSAPTNTLVAGEASYGHYGITSADATLTAGDEFGSNLWAGNITTAREVFLHDGPADGTTVDVGQTEVGFQIQIGSLQEAANDYNNTLMYIATPTF